MALLFPIVLGHFFLFCNVFRVRRKYELIWAFLFIVNAGAWWLCDSFGWWPVLATQAPITLFFIAKEVVSPEYHGIFHTQIRRR